MIEEESDTVDTAVIEEASDTVDTEAIEAAIEEAIEAAIEETSGTLANGEAVGQASRC